MTRRTARRVGFLGLFALAPLPMLFLEGALVPAARYALLAALSAAVVVSEGASSAGTGIALIFAAHALGYGLLCWGAAALLARALCALPRPLGSVWLWGLLALGIALVLRFDVYRTPFGRAPWGNLLDALS